MSDFTALMTTIYPVPDLARAKAWYADAFGVKPYFDEPFYVGFNIAGYELGLHPVQEPLYTAGNRGGTAYWGVADAAATFARLLKLGATQLDEVRDVGGGIRVAMVADPFGNAIGIIQNPGFPNTA